MKIIIDNTCIPWRDAMDLLYFAANRQDKKLRDEFVKVKKLFDGCEDAYQAAEELYALSGQIEKTEDLAYYFEEYGEGKYGCVAFHLVNLFLEERRMTVAELKERAKERFFSCSKEEFPVFESGDWSLKKEKRPLIESVRRLEVEEKFQARLLFSFADYANAIERIGTLLEEALALLKPFEERVKKEAGEFRAYWEKQENLEELLSQNGIYLDGSQYKTIRLIPLFVNRICIRIFMQESEGQELLVEMGVGLTREIVSRLSTGEKYDRELLLDTLKILSDANKLEILLYIKEQDHYGKEIADQLHLSAATISYHMEELWQHSLTVIRQEGKRLYYGLNREKIAWVLEEAKKLFLE